MILLSSDVELFRSLLVPFSLDSLIDDKRTNNDIICKYKNVVIIHIHVFTSYLHMSHHLRKWWVMFFMDTPRPAYAYPNIFQS